MDETGTVFTYTGLDDGQYRLTETKAPIGYEINRSTETLEVTEIGEDSKTHFTIRI